MVLIQRRNEGLPRMQRANQCGSLLFKIFILNAPFDKKLLKNIAIFAVKISFSQRYVLITFLFSNLIKEVLNNFVYTARVSQKIRKLLK